MAAGVPNKAKRDFSKTGRNSSRRVELSRERIVQAALDLIDQNGLNSLSMRDLGSSLGASTMSVYRYFNNKAELLDAIVDQVIANLVSTPLEDSWQAQLKTIALRVRAAILEHPNLAPLLTGEFRRSPTSLYVNSIIIEQMLDSGVPQSFLAEFYWAIACYANGYALLEAQQLRRGGARREAQNQEERVRKSENFIKSVDQVSPLAVKDLARVISHPIGDEQFLLGLDCLIIGLDQKIAS